MENIIEVDIVSTEFLYEKYNNKLISKELLDYIINNYNYNKKDNIKIVINNKTGEKNIIPLIKNSIKNEYYSKIKDHKNNNMIQFIYFIIGTIFLIGSILIGKSAIINELLLIGGWVLIWESIEIEMFADYDNRIKRKKLKKLLNHRKKGTINTFN